MTRKEETEVLKSVRDKELLTATPVNISKSRSSVLWVTKATVNTPAESQIHHSQSPAKTKQCSYNTPIVSPCRLGFSCRAERLQLEYSTTEEKRKRNLSGLLCSILRGTAVDPWDLEFIFVSGSAVKANQKFLSSSEANFMPYSTCKFRRNYS